MPHPAIVKLLKDPQPQIVCKMCAMKETFGSNYKQSKRFKEWDAKQKHTKRK